MNKPKSAVFWLMLALMAAALYAVVQAERPPHASATYSQFLDLVESGEVARVTIASRGAHPSNAVVELKNGRTVQTMLPADYRAALSALIAKHVNTGIKDATSGFAQVLANSLPFLILLALWLFLWQKRRGLPSAPFGSANL